MTGAQIALASGALISLGLVLAVWRLVPATPDLERRRASAVAPAGTATGAAG